MSQDSTVTVWIDRLKEGDHDAARKLWGNFYQPMVELARRRLGGSPRRQDDAEDVALSAFKSFCVGMDGGKFQDVSDRDNLWPLLVSITANKAVDLVRYETRKKRPNPANRVSDGEDGSSNPLDLIADEALSPDISAQMREQFDQLLDSLEDDELRHIALLKLEGYTNAEIAEKMDRTERTIERKVQRIRVRWEAQESNDSNDFDASS